MSIKQRLVVCLDGTWNKQDDSTNVLHHFALALNGASSDRGGQAIQSKHYLAGVGTGVLDRISGGGFAFGLEANVRAAYDWLVENYRDDDEIYIFGFSRGAYTARSLVGFISTCGLLKRGAPLSINQLWKDYCVLGRQREHRTSVWDRIFEEPPTTIRRINDLICDPWNIDRFERHRDKKSHGLTLASGAKPSRVRGQLVDKLKTTTEWLLVRWSRRVRITYLGVYDTVGAVGIDALAIPGLKSRLAMHHNMRPTTLIQHCRHALALDEHRSSFTHTPFMQYIGHGRLEDDRQGVALQAVDEDEDGGEVDEKARTHWQRSSAMWQRKIEQRWFPGAHSNVGGGYFDNELAQRPLAWLLEGARHCGLDCEPLPYAEPIAAPKVQDSYAEFVRPLWTDVIRGKRFYRRIDPEPELRARRPQGRADRDRAPGFSLRSINEDIDDTVFDRVRQVPDYRPPNLVEYARRKLAAPAATDAELTAELRALASTPPVHVWLGAGVAPYIILIVWASFGGFGLVPMIELFAPEIVLEASLALGLMCGSLAFLFALIDWGESRANFSLALGPSSPGWRAFLDSVYWTRALGFILAVVGGGAAAALLWSKGWNGDLQQLETLIRWWPVPLLAGAGVLLANELDGARGVRRRSGFIAAASGVFVAALAVVVLIAVSWLAEKIFRPAFGFNPLTVVAPAPRGHAAGLLILLQCGLVYVVIAFRWAAEPMSTSNLGSIVPLQLCRTPNQVHERLETWRRLLTNHWSGNDRDPNGPAGVAMRDAVRQALWRDMFGLIPVYGLTFGFGVWYAIDQLGRRHEWGLLAFDLSAFAWWSTLAPLALAVPFVAVVADYIEDICHLRYLALHEAGRKAGIWLTTPAFTMSIIKLAAFAIANGLTVAGFVIGAIEVPLLGESTGWRGSVALLVSEIVLFMVVLTAVGYIGSQVSRPEAIMPTEGDDELAELGM
jgi:uncharacterized protein (DUF2235 family)